MFIRVTVIAVLVLSVLFVSLYFYLREGKRMRLEEEWLAQGQPGERTAWIRERLAPQADRMMRWLVLWVYVLPLAVLSGIVFFTQS